MSKKVLIVGGVAGGASAAARLRRMDESAQIIMFERDEYVSFANCGLPYYIGDSIKERSKLLVQTPEGLKQRFGIEVRIQSEVIRVDTAKKTVQVRSVTDGVYEESYDSLILSPGAKPIRPKLEGIDLPQVMSLRNIPDTDKIKAKVAEQGTHSAVVIGGGFIGLEMAENLREIGLEVSLVEGGSQLLAPFDPELAAPLAKEMVDRGVELYLNERVQGFAQVGTQVSVQLESGLSLQADLVILAIGVMPDTGFLKDSGLALGARGHIIVNEYLQTSNEHVYAAGDAIEVVDFMHGTQTAVPLAGPANKQGRIAADNVSGQKVAYKGTQGTSIIKVFDLTGAATGSNEKTLQRLGVQYHALHVHPSSHAGYYPGATQMSLKLLFQPDGTLLGAQAVGYEGVDKRIDVIATVLRMRGKVSDLTELELAYAPPFSSAKDPVNMAGYAAENVLAGMVELVAPAQLLEKQKQGLGEIMLLDVRTPLEFANGHIAGAVNIPVDDLRQRMSELNREQEIWIYCQVGLRGYTSARILQQQGFRVKNVSGGYKTYQLLQYQPRPANRSGQAAQTGGASGGSGSSSNGKDSNTNDGESHRLSSQIENKKTTVPDATLDACGLCCPGPLIQVKQQIDQLESGQSLQVKASDPGFWEDIKAWAAMTGNTLVERNRLSGGIIEAMIEKGGATGQVAATSAQSSSPAMNGSTMVVFSGDLDKAIASFIIANGAASSGKKVTMFFTFWGLSVIKKAAKPVVKKGFVAKMFDAMLPSSSRKLSLSSMNMAGAGPVMIRSLMKHNNVASLEELMQSAIQQGVELVACQMSMDLLGIAREELLNEVGVGGVGYYLGQAEHSAHNLFI